MKLLKTIKEKDVFLNSELNTDIKYGERSASRAVVFDQEGKIALLDVSKDGYYKLPGGGIKKGESITEALKRECLEEIGCNIKIKNEIGETLEFRDKYQLKQISYCYIAEVDGKKGEPHFEQKEIDDGFKVVWISLDKAIRLLKESKTVAYNGKFIVSRDLTFLETAKSEL